VHQNGVPEPEENRFAKKGFLQQSHLLTLVSDKTSTGKPSKEFWILHWLWGENDVSSHFSSQVQQDSAKGPFSNLFQASSCCGNAFFWILEADSRCNHYKSRISCRLLSTTDDRNLIILLRFCLCELCSSSKGSISHFHSSLCIMHLRGANEEWPSLKQPRSAPSCCSASNTPRNQDTLC